jgi:hypothetical protein
MVNHIYLHSVIALAGTPKCGKTHFAKNFLIPELKKQLQEVGIIPNIHYLASEDIRKNLINRDLPKDHARMSEVSSNTFEFLKLQLEHLLKFPVNSHFVILDTTGLTENFHQEIANICQKYCYDQVIINFNFKKRSEYYKYCDDRDEKEKVEHQREKLIKLIDKFPPTAKKIRVDKFYSQEFPFKIAVQNLQQYTNKFLPKMGKYVIMNDITNYNKFVETLNQEFFEVKDGVLTNTKYKDNKIIINGNLFDSQDPEKVMDMIHQNLNLIYLIKTPQSDIIYKLLTKQVSELNVDLNQVPVYYHVIKNNQEKHTKFMKLYEQMQTYYQYQADDSKSRSFIVTYMPTKPNMLFRGVSTHENQEFKTPENIITCISDNDSFNKPYLVFGQFKVSEVYFPTRKQSHNVILHNCPSVTSIKLGNYISRLEIYKKYDPNQEKKERKQVTQEDIDKLIGEDQFLSSRVESVINKKVNFISGTVCPADKDLSTNSLETPVKALEYFLDLYEKKQITNLLSVEPKYMGSRMQLYYFPKTPNTSYGVSRNGFIPKLDAEVLKKLTDKLANKLQDFIQKYDPEIIILDGELMPWKAFGKGLIETEFMNSYMCAQHELDILKAAGYEELEASFMSNYDASTYTKEANVTSKKELEKKFGQSQLQSFGCVREHRKYYRSTTEQQKSLDIFKEQLELFAKDGEVHYKPFTILKIVTKDKEIVCCDDNTYTQTQLFKLVSDDKNLILDMTQDKAKLLYDLNEFWQEITVRQKLEGIVMKPDVVNLNHAAYIKVRNLNYLHIIYGHNYLHGPVYQARMNKKQIMGKLRASIKEYHMGVKMLRFKHSDITNDNLEYKRLLISFLKEETENIKSLDPAL